ncbi:MAG TPA: PadR family transcriptional regulator [Thermoanaerobaculia bacterium]|nr:PadR family transcriptional regulator [Thermoanaerobaculia bacterium]
MAEAGLDLLRGTLDVLVMKSLSWGPLHGYGVAEWIGRRTGEEILVEEGALYPALHRLEKRGLVESDWGLSENNRRARYYQLTAAGRRRLAGDTERWRRYRDAVDRVLGAVEA